MTFARILRVGVPEPWPKDTDKALDNNLTKAIQEIELKEGAQLTSTAIVAHDLDYLQITVLATFAK